MRTIEQVNYEIGKIEYKIESLQADINRFEYSLTDAEYDDYLDETCEDVSICGMTYTASYALKKCDPIAYRCMKSDYESDFDLDDCTEYTDMVEELESLNDELESLKDELDDLESSAWQEQADNYED